MFKLLQRKINYFLETSGQSINIDLPYFAKGGFWIGLGQIINNILAFVLAVAFANRLNPATYGTYNYLISIFGTLSLFALPGIDIATAQAVARNYDQAFYQGFRTKIKWSLAGSLIALAIGCWYLVNKQTSLALALFLGGMILPLMYAPEVYQGFLSGKKLFAQKTTYNSMSQAFSALLLIITLFLTSNLLVIVSIFLISQAGTNLFFYLLTKNKYQPNTLQDPQTITYGKHLSVLHGVGIVSSYIDRFLLFHFLGPVNLAIYSFAISPVRRILTTFSNLSHLMLPKLSRKKMAEINLTLYKRTFQLLIIGVLTTILFILFLPYLYRLFFPKYLSSIPYSRLFAISLVLNGVSPFLGSVFRAKKLTKALYISGLSTQLLLIILVIILGKSFGITGVILAQVIAPFYSAILTLILWKHHLRLIKKD